VTRALTIRTELRPGDLGEIVKMHGVFYAREFGFDSSFQAYVAGPLADFARRAADRERIWIAEDGARIVGVVAIVAASDEAAQLRWFLVDPETRGLGLGTTLLAQAVEFSRSCGYRRILLWTVRALEAAARLYRAAGFVPTEATPGRHWGVDVIEERYDLSLTA